MTAWVTLRSGEVLQYNECGSTDESDGWLYLRENMTSQEKHTMIAKIRRADVLRFEFRRPCEVTWVPDVFERSLQVVLAGATTCHRKHYPALKQLKGLLWAFDGRKKRWK